MPDTKKVISGLKCCRDIHFAGPGYAQSCYACPYSIVKAKVQCNGGYACVAALFDDAIELLKDRDPVKPNVKQEISDIDLCIHDRFYCGHCGTKVWRLTHNYCQNCGRPVKWGD